MNPRWWTATRFALIASFVLLAPAATAQVKRAVLIGVDDYLRNDPSKWPPGAKEHGDDVTNLTGCVNDVQMIRTLLIERFGFPDDPNLMRVRTNETATRDEILKQLTWLAEESGKNDVALFYFSGHGATIRDKSRDDQGKDETWVPYDARVGKGRDVVDDEIGKILKGVKTDHFTLILDCCHSGTSTRALVETRGAGEDDPDLYADLDGGTKALVKDIKDRYLVMAAAAAEQEALAVKLMEDDGKSVAHVGGTSNGIFTYSLVKALRENPAMSVTDLNEVVRDNIIAICGTLPAAEFKEIPEPQFEGKDARYREPILPDPIMPTGEVAPMARTRVPVAIAGEGGSRLAGELEAWVPGIDTSAAASESRVSVASRGGSALVQRRGGSGSSGSGAAGASVTTGDDIEPLAAEVQRALLADAFAQMATPGDVEFDVRVVGHEGDGAPEYELWQGRGFPKNGSNSAQLEIRATANGYLTIVDVDPSGGVSVRYPPLSYEGAELYLEGDAPVGDYVAFPDSITTNPNRRSFYLSSLGPAGLGTLVVFLSTSRSAAERLSGRLEAIGKEVGRVEVGEARPGRSFRRALDAIGRLGAVREDWAMATVPVRLVPPGQ